MTTTPGRAPARPEPRGSAPGAPWRTATRRRFSTDRSIDQGATERPKEHDVSTMTRRTLSTRFALASAAGLLTAARPLAGLAQGTPAAASTATTKATTLDPATVIDRITDADGILRFDVAEDVSRFVFAPQPLYEDGMPAPGNAFITQGYIYPEGTLDGGNGALADGQAEFPELLLGEWTCRGWFVGDAAHATTGPMVITTQVYGFGNGWGAATLISEGYELVDIGAPVRRAITGGTGPYVGARGEAVQTLLGFTEQMSVNQRFALAPTGMVVAASAAAGKPRTGGFTWAGAASFGGDA